MADLLAPRTPRGRSSSQSCKLGLAEPNSSNARRGGAITFLAEEDHSATPELARIVRPYLRGEGSATTLHTGSAKKCRIIDAPTWPRPVVGQGQPRSGETLARIYNRSTTTPSKRF